MAPAETFSDSQEHIEATFTYANCALQNFQLNRGLWKVLEMKERQMSQIEKIKVINTVIFTKPFKKLASGTYIPSGFRKEIISVDTGKRMIYEFPNSETTHSIFDYQIQNDFDIAAPVKGKKDKEVFRPDFQHNKKKDN